MDAQAKGASPFSRPPRKGLADAGWRERQGVMHNPTTREPLPLYPDDPGDFPVPGSFHFQPKFFTANLATGGTRTQGYVRPEESGGGRRAKLFRGADRRFPPGLNFGEFLGRLGVLAVGIFGSGLDDGLVCRAGSGAEHLAEVVLRRGTEV